MNENQLLLEAYIDELDFLGNELSHEVDIMENNVDDLKQVKKHGSEKINLLLDGLKSAQQITFLFSPSINEFLGKIVSSIENGTVVEDLKNINNVKLMVNKTAGFVLGKANSVEINNRIVDTIYNTINNEKFKKTKYNLFKVIKIIKNLKKEKRTFINEEERKQFEIIVRSMLELAKVIKNIIKNRNIIINQIKKNSLCGNYITEDVNNIPKLARLI